MRSIARTAGLLDLEHEIRSSSDAELIEQISLLIEVPQPLQIIAWPRLRIATWELRRRLAEVGVAA